MKKSIFLFVMLASTIVKAVDVSDKLLDAICDIESHGNSQAVGDSGKAVGVYQIHKIYVDDVNSFSKTQYTYEDRKDKTKSRAMVKAYLEHYGKVYEKKTGETANNEVLARIHNGGPNGYKKDATKKYWNKIEKELK